MASQIPTMPCGKFIYIVLQKKQISCPLGLQIFPHIFPHS